MSSRRQVLWLISVLTLAAQLLGLLHLAIEEHTLTAAGQVVEPLLIEADAHEHAGAHLCASEALRAEEPDQGCAVAASWTTSGLLLDAGSAGLLAATSSPERAVTPRPFVDDDVLARAPKGSPPVG